jgi:hypothetical protein
MVIPREKNQLVTITLKKRQKEIKTIALKAMCY